MTATTATSSTLDEECDALLGDECFSCQEHSQFCGFCVDESAMAATTKTKKQKTKVSSEKMALEGGEDNLSNHQRQLLKCHHRLSHVDMSQMQSVARQGILPLEISKCKIPLCRNCEHGKAHLRSHTNAKGEIGNQHDSKPGLGVSVDQLEAATPG